MPIHQQLRRKLCFCLAAFAGLPLLSAQQAGGQAVGVTSLANLAVKYSRPAKSYVVLKRGPIEAVVVDNSAVDDDVLHGHRAGYSGLALLRHQSQNENLFVPAYSGLNFEHILDGTAPADRRIQFEPRNHPMELRVIGPHTAELCQTPTFHHALESCQRYELLDDGTIELTIELIARRPTFSNGYINLFWASYINQPASLDIHFRGLPVSDPTATPTWIRGVTPSHGELSTHRSTIDNRVFAHDKPFPLTLVHSLSNHRFTEPWYFGICRGMAFVQMFRPADQVRITQSPSGGGKGNPAWDFQFYVPDYEPGRLYRFRMRAAYLPYESHAQIEAATRGHRAELARPVR
jgi:hypothetical protein